MNRLLLAAVVALAIHVVLLLAFIPRLKVFEPEIEGSGQVTISIMQSSLPDEETAAEPDLSDVPVQEEEKIEEATTEPPVSIENKTPEPLQEIVEVMPEPEKKVSVKETSVQEIAAAQEETSSVPAQEEQPAMQSQYPRQQVQVQDGKDAAATDQEILQDPEPIGHLNRPPEYPQLARKRGWEGTVVLEVDILSSGMVKGIKVVQSSSFSMLDREALEAVEQWHFKPGSKGGKFVDMKVLVPVHFILQEQ